jgi:CDP-diacylglycerol--inositol 3-phosphatidyltransferase
MALTNVTSSQASTKHFFLFPANIIGFIRIALLVSLFATLRQYPMISVSIYSAVLLLDGVDGYLARRFNQTTAFGTILDMITDRASVALLLLVLSIIDQARWWLYASLLLIDLSSHLAIIYSTAIAQKQSHKQTLMQSHAIMKLYYGKRWFLSLICASHDFCLCAIYLYIFMPSAALLWCMSILSIGLLIKTYIHLLQLYYAFKIASHKDVFFTNK